MNIIACENAIRGSSQLKAAVYDHLSEEGKKYADEYIGFRTAPWIGSFRGKERKLYRCGSGKLS